MEKSIKKILILPFVVLLNVYRLLVSPWLANSCRYQPTCSEYAKDAFRLHGVVKGTYLTTHRVLRCHPWGGSGYNPVPSPEDAKCVADHKGVSVNKAVNKQKNEISCAVKHNINKPSVE